MMNRKQVFATVFILLLFPPVIQADNWPQFRGPDHQGHSSESGLPLKWSDTENVAWRIELPGQSWSSPIVWGNRVFVTTTLNDGVSCRVLSIDSTDGSIQWNKEVFEQTLLRKEDRNTYATPTPATDGEKVYACFGDGSFVALNYAGDIVWTNRDHPFYGQHGLGTSPILYDGMLIMARDGSSDGQDKKLGWQTPWDQSYVVAIDTATGKFVGLANEECRGFRTVLRVSGSMMVRLKLLAKQAMSFKVLTARQASEYGHARSRVKGKYHRPLSGTDWCIPRAVGEERNRSKHSNWEAAVNSAIRVWFGNKRKGYRRFRR